MAAYIRDPRQIYQESFAIVRAETDLSRFPADVADIVIRLVHACGMPEITRDIAWSPDIVSAARAALDAGKPIVTDVRMVDAGIMRPRLAGGSAVLCSINDPTAADTAKRDGTTRSAASIESLADEWAGGIVAIGSAPTALFRVLELVEQGRPPPAAILGFPVGFVGAAESKEALIEAKPAIPYLTLRGRRGGSALAAAAVNALAGPLEG